MVCFGKITGEYCLNKFVNQRIITIIETCAYAAVLPILIFLKSVFKQIYLKKYLKELSSPTQPPIHSHRDRGGRERKIERKRSSIIWFNAGPYIWAIGELGVCIK